MSTERLTRHPLLRVALVCVIGVLFVGFSPTDTTPAQWLLLAACALATAWMLNSVVVVLVPALLLSAAHTDLSSELAGPRLWYPLVAASSALVLLALIGQRFVKYMRATRAARHAARAERAAAAEHNR